MSFMAGLAGGAADALNRETERQRQEAARARAAERAAAGRGMPQVAGEPMGRGYPEGPAPYNPPPPGGFASPPKPEEPHASTFDPRRGVFANGSRMSRSPAQNGLTGLIDRTEGGGRYDTLFGHAQRPGGGDPFDGIDVSSMTLGQLKQFSDPSGHYGQWVKQELAENGHRARVATPMGRHQIVGTTLRSTAEAMGLSDDTVFSPAVQDSMFQHLARQRLSAARSPAAKRAAPAGVGRVQARF